MKMKSGISLVTLIITIIVMVIIVSVTIAGTTNVIGEAKKNDFAVELSTITDKIKEYYLTFGNLPVKNIKFNIQEVLTKQTDKNYKEKLNEEIAINKDLLNEFYVVDLKVLNIEGLERGITEESVDIFLVSSTNLNVYYLKGVNAEGELYFSMAKLTGNNMVNQEVDENITQVELDEKLSVTKSTNTWTNEIKIYINNQLSGDEIVRYYIAGKAARTLESGKEILINLETLTSDEKEALQNNKTVVIELIKNQNVIKTAQINIDNLDILNPTLGVMEVVDTTNANYNTIKINSSDLGGSNIKAIYYDYNKILKEGVEKDYYLDKNLGSRVSLLKVGQISKDGIIKLEKHIKSILVIVLDNAGNISDIVTYTIADKYVVSK